MSQKSRIVKMLRVGPATTAEILREVPCVVHSRIAQLRDEGYGIVCERVGGIGAGVVRAVVRLRVGCVVVPDRGAAARLDEKIKTLVAAACAKYDSEHFAETDLLHRCFRVVLDD